MARIKQKSKKASWPDQMRRKELEKLVRYNRINCQVCIHNFSYIKEDPITEQTIDNLIKDGWKVQENISDECLRKSREIYLRTITLIGCGFIRDVTLFHEIVHAYYDFLDDGFFLPHFCDNNAIVEWTARQLRTNSDLLKHVVNSFGLTQRIYDKASYLAFSGSPLALYDNDGEQLSFKFAANYRKEFTKIRMD